MTLAQQADPHCGKCNVKLIAGENWPMSKVRAKNYVCKPCYNEQQRDAFAKRETPRKRKIPKVYPVDSPYTKLLTPIPAVIPTNKNVRWERVAAQMASEAVQESLARPFEAVAETVDLRKKKTP